MDMHQKREQRKKEKVEELDNLENVNKVNINWEIRIYGNTNVNPYKISI